MVRIKNEIETFLKKSFFKKLLFSIFFVVIILIFYLNINSNFDFHPDENSHFTVSQYFVKNWLNPPVGHESIHNTYSIWGHSYMDELDIIYFFSGKFSILFLKTFPEYLTFRFFQLFLLLLFCVYCFSKKDKLILMIVFLISTQVWYVFCYLNADTLPLIASLILSYEIFGIDTITNRYLKSFKFKISFNSNPIFAGFLIFLLILGKRNYYIYLIYLFVFFLIRLYYQKKNNLKIMFLKLILVGVISILLAAPKLIHDTYINGFDKFQKRIDYAEKVAGSEFKPSIYGTEKSYHSIMLRKRGVQFTEMFNKYQWHINSYQSFVGCYSFLNILSSDFFYFTILYLYLFFLVCFYLTILIKSPKKDLVILGISILFIFFVIFISFYYSWNLYLQAQGRYLFPILPILLGTFLYYKKYFFKFYVLVFPIIGILGIYTFYNRAFLTIQ